MSLNADALQFLLDKGLTLADAVEFARLTEKKKDPTNAERQARYRANNPTKRNALRNGVTPPIDNNHTPSNSPSEAKASLAPKGKATRLPVDWQAEPLSGETEAMVSAWPEGMLERELSKFRDYWAAASGRRAAKLDWNAAFRNWLRNANEWASRNGTANRSNHQNGAPRDGFAAVLRDVGSREDAFAAAGDDGGLRPSAPVGLIASG